MLDVLGAWGDAHPAGWHADFNDDGVVDLVDLLTVLNSWS